MGKIIQLDTHLANQIAAWEVVERPVSVVKELVENSIDAWADVIQVFLQDWGKTSIQVTDNGEGISKSDLEICLDKYTTSKIKTLTDLFHVMTFWFRWEALASISSVSKFEIISKIASEISANKLTFDTLSGKKFSQASHNTGTTIYVKDLFYNTPARLNYLKTEKTEYTKILDYLHSVALWVPEVGIEFFSQGKKICFFPPHQNALQRMYEIYGEEVSKEMLEISFEAPWVRISWYMSDPKVSFGNKNRQNVFVNKRPIFSPLISKAVSDAYNRYIPHGTYPAYVIYLEVDPTIIDVNVHPRKQEVRFENEQNIFRSLYHALSQKLEKVSLLSTSQEENVWEKFSEISPATSHNIPSTPSYYTWSGTKFKSYSPYKDTSPHPSQSSFSQALDFTKNILSTHENISGEFSDTHTWDLHYTKLGKIIGQAFFSYILVEREWSLVMLDQHALAERVIYEKLLSKNTKDVSQKLLLPETLKLTPSEYDTLKSHGNILQESWFEFEELSHSMISLLSLPNFIKKQEAKEIFLWILGDIQAGNTANFTSLEEVKNKIFAYTACRSAIKFWNKLNLFEMNALLNESVDTYSSTCPHGRPVIYEISLTDLKNKYER